MMDIKGVSNTWGGPEVRRGTSIPLGFPKILDAAGYKIEKKQPADRDRRG
jgi:hypothetical protein